ncbi:MAG: hypothetical protein R3C26_23475 [Calditrichia bacterium]
MRSRFGDCEIWSRCWREHPLLFITGFAGSGKSVLMSTYIYQQVFNRSLAIGKIFTTDLAKAIRHTMYF